MQSYWEKQSQIYNWSKIILVLSILLFSCTPKKEVMKPFNPTPPEIVDKDIDTPPGSLYTGYDNLFSDDKALKVGDTITIKITENISGQGSAQSDAKKNTDINYDFPSPKWLGKDLVNKTPIAGMTAKSSDTFQGSGKTQRNAKLVAKITARVVKVYPNGNLFVIGKKIIRINDDIQELKISGIVKPTYIQQDNSVDSSRISDMYVEYNGKGYIADHQRPGWLARFLTKIWPF